jgi:hypothetical protein
MFLLNVPSVAMIINWALSEIYQRLVSLVANISVSRVIREGREIQPSHSLY